VERTGEGKGSALGAWNEDVGGAVEKGKITWVGKINHKQKGC